MDENHSLYPGAYPNSSDLARETPHVRLSRPTPPDNTEWFDHDHQIVKEPAKVCLCFDCQQPVEPGKGVQVRRHGFHTLRGLDVRGVNVPFEQVNRPIPMDSIVHPECNLEYEASRGLA